ncbi:hnh endonuclease [Eubacterium sp. CAG:786]|nr:hnh endonuclease [Eubacterium sp. CAG:786]
MSCYSEDQIVLVVLEIIKDQPGIRTSELIDEARRIMKPSGEDLEILDNRNDDKFSQKVRNIKSHDTIESLVRTEGERNRRWYLK